MKNIIKKLSVLCVFAAALMFSPASQTPASALGSGLQTQTSSKELVTQVHYRGARHNCRHHGYCRYYRHHRHHYRHHYRHHRRHHGVRVRIYL
jgi:hypothetical protein